MMELPCKPQGYSNLLRNVHATASLRDRSLRLSVSQQVTVTLATS